MTAGWVAATMRGRALLRSATGVDGARSIATAPSWGSARDLLDRSLGGQRLSAEADRVRARDAASSATAWQLRVLAGWVPAHSSSLVRIAAGPIEIGNIEGHLAVLDGGPRTAPVALGSLATAWPRVATATSPDAVREVLRRSVWGDPGGSDQLSLRVGLRIGWLRRVLVSAPEARSWVRGSLAVLVARERFVFGREIPAVTARGIDLALGRRWRVATTLRELVAGLPAPARWPLEEVQVPDDLWLAEREVVRRIDTDASSRAHAGRGDRETFVAILALMLLDLWRVRAAIDLAGRGDVGGEAFDAVAA